MSILFGVYTISLFILEYYIARPVHAKLDLDEQLGLSEHLEPSAYLDPDVRAVRISYSFFMRENYFTVLVKFSYIPSFKT